MKAGDVVTVALDRTVRIMKVTGFAERRGDADAARVLYEDLTPKPEPSAAPRNRHVGERDAGSGRPTKQERRAIDRLLGDGMRPKQPCVALGIALANLCVSAGVPMTYIVNDSCIRCKFMDCVSVCPVDCFYEGENMLVIHPDECIDCGVCEPECPVEAIKPDTEPGLEEWLKLNADYSKVWPNITVKREPPPDAQGVGRQAGQDQGIFAKSGQRATSARTSRAR